MKTLSDFIMEAESSDEMVYSVYYDDGTLYNYYNDKNEADLEAEKLTSENPDFPAVVKREKKSEFEK